MEIVSRRHPEPSPLSDEEFAAFMGEVGPAGLTEDARRAAFRVLEEARAAYDAREPFRRERREGRDLWRGGQKQWGRRVTDAAGNVTTEAALLAAQGRTPVVMNVVAPMMATIEGNLRQNRSERAAFAETPDADAAAQQINAARRALRRRNESAVIEADQGVEHVLSGASGFKLTFEWDGRTGRHEVKDYDLDQTRFFYNADIYDRRFTGLRVIGEVHDLPPQELVRNFARSRADAERIAAFYGRSGAQLTGTAPAYGFDGADAGDFMAPARPDDLRVVEAWMPVFSWVRRGVDPLYELLPDGVGVIAMNDADFAREQNRRRAAGLPLVEADEARYEPHWHCYQLTPDAHVLYEGPTPFRHGDHPYAPGLARLVDGETWGIVSNVADPQRWLNRLLVGLDHSMTAGSKGLLVYNKRPFTDAGLSQEDVERAYQSANGTIGVDLQSGEDLKRLFHREVATTLPAGYFELVPVLVDFVQRISGVTEAAQGMAPKSGTPAALHQQMVIQAAVNVLGYVQTYYETLRRKDLKEIALVQQCYLEPRAYAGAQGQPVVYDPATASAATVDVALGEVGDTATMRQLQEADLRADFERGVIPPEIYYRRTSRPDGREILADLQEWQAQQAAAQAEMLAADPDLALATMGGGPGNTPTPR